MNIIFLWMHLLAVAVIPDPRTKPTLTLREASEILEVSVATMSRSVARGDFPGVIRLGPRTVRIATAQLLTLLGVPDGDGLGD